MGVTSRQGSPWGTKPQRREGPGPPPSLGPWRRQGVPTPLWLAMSQALLLPDMAWLGRRGAVWLYIWQERVGQVRQAWQSGVSTSGVPGPGPTFTPSHLILRTAA